jgi:serine/threonine protein kinase/Flp pilus assembly protein TadD
MNEELSEFDPVDEAAEEFVERYRQGERPALSEYTEKYPAVADKIRALFPALVAMEQAGQVDVATARSRAREEAVPRQLGDYQIVREIGRGGMGVVYEAVQESLGRHVALKVLSGSRLVDPMFLERFRREARAAARLHHTNIVPVFGVGEHDGIHYYAMQYIQGQGLDQVLQQVRRLRQAPQAIKEVGRTPDSCVAASLAQSLLSGCFRARQESADPDTSTVLSRRTPDTQASGPTHDAALSLSGNQPESKYFRSVALIAVQVAEALEFAHRQGVLHRDIKPSNLLLGTTGQVWVTDFGLAKIEGAGELTEMGDIVGTLRYMAPERFRGRSDPRSDVYSLGMTLYELLTLRPAFEAPDRAQLFMRVTRETPPRPRRLDPLIPRDLETIVLKAIAMESGDRYATAEALAEDLRRFLSDRPIRARRIWPVEHVWRWCRRNRAVASLMACVLVMLMLGLGGWLWHEQQRDAEQTRIRQDIHEALTQATAFMEQAKAAPLRDERLWVPAQEQAQRAAALVRSGGVEGTLKDDVQRLLDQLALEQKRRRLLRALDAAWLAQTETDGQESMFLTTRVIPLFGSAFWDYGLALGEEEPAAVAGRIQQEPEAVRDGLLAALNEWISWGPHPECGLTEHHVLWARAVLLEADRDPWRTELRTAWWGQRVVASLRVELVELAARADVERQPPRILNWLANGLWQLGAPKETVNLLHRARQANPGDFWLNEKLGVYLEALKPPQLQEAARYLTAAVALRPDSAGAYVNLGDVLYQQGDVAGAIAACTSAIARNPKYATAHNNLGTALRAQKDLPGAIAAYRTAINHNPKFALAFDNLGKALYEHKDLDGAAAAFRTVCTLEPKNSRAHTQLGEILCCNGDLQGAIVAYKQAIAADPDNATAHHGLAQVRNMVGLVLLESGREGEAIAEFREAIAIDVKLASAHVNLGNALWRLKDAAGAITAYRTAIDVDPAFAPAYANLGNALCQSDVPGAIAACKKAIELDEKLAVAWRNLGRALREQGDLPGAMAAYRTAINADSKDADTHYFLANALTKHGDLPAAIGEYEQALRCNPRFAMAHNNLGHVRSQLGDLPGAIAAYNEAVKLDANFAEAYCNLGYALLRQGKFAEARDAYRRGHELGSRRSVWKASSAEWVKHAGRLADLDNQVTAILNGRDTPRSAGQCIEYAQLCSRKRFHVASARFYLEAFAKEPALADDLSRADRYQAACSAALAGTGQGNDAGLLDEQQRERSRQQALEWFRADLAAWTKRTQGSNQQDRAEADRKLRQWERNRDLAAVREEDALARLPEAERRQWQMLWADVSELRKRAASDQ